MTFQGRERVFRRKGASSRNARWACVYVSARARVRAVSVDVRASALAADVFLQAYWLCHLILSLGSLTLLH
jgi:hypothetical protein